MLSPRDTWVRETRPHSRGMARGGCQQKGPAVALKAVTGGVPHFQGQQRGAGEGSVYAKR